MLNRNSCFIWQLFDLQKCTESSKMNVCPLIFSIHLKNSLFVYPTEIMEIKYILVYSTVSLSLNCVLRFCLKRKEKEKKSHGTLFKGDFQNFLLSWPLNFWLFCLVFPRFEVYASSSKRKVISQLFDASTCYSFIGSHFCAVDLKTEVCGMSWNKLFNEKIKFCWIPSLWKWI